MYRNTPKCSSNSTEFRFLKFDIEDEDPTDDYSQDGNQHCEFDSVEIGWLNERNRKNTTGRLCHLVERNKAHYHGAKNIKDYDGNNPQQLGYYEWTQVKLE